MTMTVFIGKYSSFVHGSRVPYFGSIEAKVQPPSFDVRRLSLRYNVNI